MKQTEPTSLGKSSGEGSISTEMLNRVRLHEPEAWEQLVALYGPAVYWCCRQSNLGPEDAADVVQEVFRAVADHVADFRRDRPGDSFRSWLWAIMRNKIRDHFRLRRQRPKAAGGTEAYQRLQQVPEPPEPPSEPENGDGILAGQALELVRAEFEDRTWQAFRHVAVEGRSPADVAEDMGMSIHAVYKAKSRVLCRLRQRFADLIE